MSTTKRVRGTVKVEVDFLYTEEEQWAPSRIVQAIQELTRGEAVKVVTEKHEVIYLSYCLEDLE